MDFKIQQSIPIIKEMLNDRLYTNISDVTLNDIDYIKAENSTETLIVNFIKTKNALTDKNFNIIITKIKNNFNLKETDKILFVLAFLEEKNVPNKYRALENETVQIFNINRLLFNIMKHTLSPIYIKLTSDEIEHLDTTWNLKNIGKIFIDDPAARYFNMKIGDVFKIIRTSNNSYQYITYRKCV